MHAFNFVCGLFQNSNACIFILNTEVAQLMNMDLLDIVPKMIKNVPKKLPNLIRGGIPALLISDTDKNSIGKIIQKNAQKYPNQASIYFEDKMWTHREVNEISNQYAHMLQHYGVKKEQVVILFMDNRPEVIFFVIALAKLGAVTSLINSHQRLQVLKNSINQRNDGFFIIGEELVEPFEEVKNEIKSPNFQVFLGVEDGGESSFPDSYISVSNIIHRFPKTNIKGVNELTAGTPFAYIFTSGTTGMPKASIQTHRKWLSCMNWFGIINLQLKTNDVIYVSIPFYHSNALLIAWSSAVVNGAAMAIRRKFSVTEFWKDVIQYRATAFIYIGDICRYLYNAPKSDLDQKHAVRKIVGNGLRPDIWKGFKERFNIEEIYEFYASSEGNMTFTNTFNLDNTVGWCASKYEIIEYDRENSEPIYDRNGFFKKVKKGEVGLMIFEISDRFPFPGYVKEEDNKNKVFKNVFKNGDTWYNTGDVMKNIGFFHAQFVDREGDTFRWKGENVSTAEVEEVMNAYEDIESCAVYGVDIPHTDGKAGMAAIVLKENRTFDGQRLGVFLEAELPSYAVPIFVRVENNLKYTSTYKVVKNELKKEGFQNCPTAVWVKDGKNASYQLLDEEILLSILENSLIF